MSGWLSKILYPHSITVEDALGSGGSTAKVGPPREVRAEVKDEQKVVIGGDSEEHVSNTQVTVPLGSDVPIGSFVTVWAGKPGERRSRVISVQRDENAPPLPSHLILSLQ